MVNAVVTFVRGPGLSKGYTLYIDHIRGNGKSPRQGLTENEHGYVEIRGNMGDAYVLFLEHHEVGFLFVHKRNIIHGTTNYLVDYSKYDRINPTTHVLSHAPLDNNPLNVFGTLGGGGCDNLGALVPCPNIHQRSAVYPDMGSNAVLRCPSR